LLFNCNITTAGGIVVTNAWQGTIAFNNIEAVVTSTEANSAVIDVQGVAAAPTQNLKIYGNYVGANASFVTDGIRVDRAVGTEIFNNLAGRGTGVAYRITPNADKTHVSYNRQVPGGESLSTYLADSGSNTIIEYVNAATGQRTITPSLTIESNTGTNGVVITSAQVKVNSTNGVFCGATGVAQATGCDTYLSRIGVNQWAMGSAWGVSDGFLFLAALDSNTPNRALTGFIRMANGDKKCHRNAANSGDDCYGEFLAARSVAGCTTAASIGGVCVTPITVTWKNTSGTATPFADTNYTAQCWLTGAPTNLPGQPYQVSKAAGSITVNYFAITAAAASWATIDCSAWHD